MSGKGHGDLYIAPTVEERRSERLRGERHQFKFIYPSFERWQTSFLHLFLLFSRSQSGAFALFHNRGLIDAINLLIKRQSSVMHCAIICCENYKCFDFSLLYIWSNNSTFKGRRLDSENNSAYRSVSRSFFSM